VPIVAAKSPADAFGAVFEACRIAIRHMTPVLFLSDGYISNGSEPWNFPTSKDIPEIDVQFASAPENGDPFMPYGRDERLVRQWAIPGMPGLGHRIGGLEKEAETGNVSYDPANHEYMTKIREAKVEKIAEFVPEQTIDVGDDSGDLLILGWGSTYGVIQSVARTLIAEGHSVSHAHLRYLRPFPRNLGELMKRFRKVLIPEMNTGQLAGLIRNKFLLDVAQYNKIQGVPITKSELLHATREVLG